MKVLIVEDEAIIRLDIAMCLRQENYEVIEAENGARGLRLAQEQSPDVIFCDLNMPDLSGFEVLEQLRQDPRSRRIPFIIFSGESGSANYRRALRLGANDYLDKNVAIEEILAAIRAVV